MCLFEGNSSERQYSIRDLLSKPIDVYTTRSGCSCTASEKEQKIITYALSFSLNVVATLTLSNTASTATSAIMACSSNGMPSLA